MVIRAFPIRVAGQSGDLPKEIGWADVTRIAGAEFDITEKTTVTKNIRRVAEFDEDIVLQSIMTNRPNIVVLNHCDYFDYSIHNQSILSEPVEKAVCSIEDRIGKIDYLGTSGAVLFAR